MITVSVYTKPNRNQLKCHAQPHSRWTPSVQGDNQAKWDQGHWIQL